MALPSPRAYRLAHRADAEWDKSRSFSGGPSDTSTTPASRSTRTSRRAYIALQVLLEVFVQSARLTLYTELASSGYPSRV